MLCLQILNFSIIFAQDILKSQMARTKQTARKSTAHKSVRRGFGKSGKACGKKQSCYYHKGKKVSLKQAPLKKQQLQKIVEEQEKIKQLLTFSLAFDDQVQCQKNSFEKQNIVSCNKCKAILHNKAHFLKIQKNGALQESKQLGQLVLNDIQMQYVQKSKDNLKVWFCQFCGQLNLIKDIQNQVQNSPCYIVNKNAQKQKQVSKQSIIIFCLDTSSSMGNFNRLLYLKQALKEELNKMKAKNQNYKVGIIGFSDTVIGYGDCIQNKKVYNQKELFNNWDRLVKEGQNLYKTHFNGNIQNCHAKLFDIVDNLVHYGTTCLGPALLMAITAASFGQIGSKVIVCTDGLANVGVGNLADVTKKDQKFYQMAGQFARQKTVSVNILTIKGDTQCSIKNLGRVSKLSNGIVARVDPKSIGTQFNKVIQEQIIGKRATIKLLLSQPYVFREQKYKLQSTIEQYIGNFTLQDQVSYNFDSIPYQIAEMEKKVNLKLYKLKELPIQLQLRYIGRDGMQYLQVFTDWRQVADNDQQFYLQQMQFKTWAKNAITQITQLANVNLKDALEQIKYSTDFMNQKFTGKIKAQLQKKFFENIQEIQNAVVSKATRTGVLDQKESKQKGKKSRSKKKQRSRSRQKLQKGGMLGQDIQEQVLFKGGKGGKGYRF